MDSRHVTISQRIKGWIILILTLCFRKENDVMVKKYVWRFMLIAILILALLPMGIKTAYAHGIRCYKGMTFFERYTGGSWHSYVYVPIGSQDYFKPVTAWHVHGPLSPQLWPDSAPGRYIMVYFSWPHGINPYLFYRPSQFQACLN
jgi:hypothetical protein